ncbi:MULTISPECIES: NAD(P)H-binding protein [unclassified Streptomyces]|uniref:NAD(P)H-binding protein n=1 Tax=Streptomycetaceae TaxID=2062 RepID=UPI002E7A260C|nr:MULTISPECIES: NAD(P)H-binding protein [unclassified Streptomyces]MED7949831.1 NAD(P)H-binding protein [Streptomyces sp. BE303]MEE1828106.1 NAD(P)H-binding protein [Streptomyces sp. BE20]
MGKILVTGATGQVGAEVLAQLLAAGADVRAGARTPEKLASTTTAETAVLDLTDPETYGPALAGVEKVFLYAVPQGTEGFLAAAKEAGVRHVVVLSSQTVVDAFPVQRPIVEMHRTVEAAVVASGIPHTFLRPHNFATNILMWGWPESIRAEGRIRFPYPESHSDAIHEKDIAAVAVVALTQPGHENQAHFLSGPASVTQREQLATLAEVLGRPLEFEELTDAEAREALSPIVPVWVMDAVVGYWAGSDGVPTELSDTVEKLTGRPARTFADWARDHASDFTA